MVTSRMVSDAIVDVMLVFRDGGCLWCSPEAGRALLAEQRAGARLCRHGRLKPQCGDCRTAELLALHVTTGKRRQTTGPAQPWTAKNTRGFYER